MSQPWKYDVAISFAEEDTAIAEAMHRALRQKCLRSFYYKTDDHNSIGRSLHEITDEYYEDDVHTGLLIVSNVYFRKRWTKEEYQRLTMAQQQGRVKRIFVIRVGGAAIPTELRDAVYAEWEGNPKEIAKRISRRVGRDMALHPCARKLVFGLSLLGLLLLIYFLFQGP